MDNKGKLYLIPSPLGDNDPAEVIPSPVLGRLQHFRTFVVEEIRTARRYLSRAGLKGKIDGLEFHELNEHTPQEQIEGYLELFGNGNDVALISEAGLPAGVINFVPSRGADVSRYVLSDPRMAGFHFTGSTEVFSQVWAQVGTDIRKYKTYLLQYAQIRIIQKP